MGRAALSAIRSDVDFWNSLKVLARRWYIVAAGLLLTLGGALGVNALIAPSYTAVGSLVLAVPPNLPERAASSNPYLAYGNLAVAAKVVASGMNQPSVVREQRTKGATGGFVVDLDPERSSPIITVNSTARTAAEAIKTVEVVTAGVQQLLADRQKSLGAPQNTWITANSVVVPEEANRAIGSRLRAVSAVLVLGVIGTLTLAFAIEGMAQGRSQPAPVVDYRSTAAASPPPYSPPPYSPPPPPAPAPDPPPAYTPALAPVGVCPLCRTAFRSAEDLAWHLEEAHGLNGSLPPPPAPRPPRFGEPAPQPEPPPARPPRQPPRRPLADAAAAVNPPARRATRPAPPPAPEPPARAPRKPASPGPRTRKSEPPTP
jgi:hypothetical protein